MNICLELARRELWVSLVLHYVHITLVMYVRPPCIPCNIWQCKRQRKMDQTPRKLICMLERRVLVGAFSDRYEGVRHSFKVVLALNRWKFCLPRWVRDTRRRHERRLLCQRAFSIQETHSSAFSAMSSSMISQKMRLANFWVRSLAPSRTLTLS